jgi:sialate O-acetylesterase
MNRNRKTRRLIFFFILSVSIVSFGQIKLPKLISDGMILQRNTPVKIWGWAAKNEKVSVRFIDSTYTTIASEDGKWNVQLKKYKEGGPYEMVIKGSNLIAIHNIMIGDVWLCSGQSNMELPMRRVSPIYKEEITNSENYYIRHFAVPQKYNFNIALEDLNGGNWKSANPETVLDFSAVAYFFAKELYAKYRVPIGLINASLGGSPAQAWISEESLKKFPDYYNEAQKFKDSSLIKKIESEDNDWIQAWYALSKERDEGYKDSKKLWSDPNLATADWATMKIPGYWADDELGFVNGIVWFRKKINVPSSLVGKPALLILGRIVDADSVFINGSFVGTTSYQYPPRRYNIPPTLLKEGENTIVIRVINNSGRGGFVPDKEYVIETENQKINLIGEWQFRLGAKMDPLASQTFIRWKPLGLYNGMIAPLLNYKIKGAIWYQGESNANRPVEYKELLSTLIYDWRYKWQQGNIPFLLVQLPNFMEAKPEPSESNWALFRESQLKTLSVANTGLVVAIDIGEWNDIHPLNKKDVGNRLALAAEKIAYGDKRIVHSGPIYKSMKVSGNKIVLTFSSIGSGLIAKDGGELKCFAIAGADKKFVWANAKIENNKVIVWSDSVNKPVAVRYAWADNPEGANLFNKEKLPASPFRTDKFK